MVLKFHHNSVHLLLLFFLVALAGCGAPQINIGTDYSAPLQEFTLEGDAEEKILLLPVRGVIDNEPDRELFSSRPGTLQEVVAQLDKAAGDENIRAVVITVDSPGGTALASDAVYKEIMDYKAQSGAKVGAVFMKIAASGGYYISMAADHITAYPMTITGSVGTIFMRPKVHELFDKVGLDVAVTKSGKNKDMFSPFREGSEEEDELFQNMVAEMNARFLSVVADSRKLSSDAMEEVATARVFTAGQALKLGLVDEIGYLDDALQAMKKKAGLPADARVVAYRRAFYANDNIYNPATGLGGKGPSLIDVGMASHLVIPRTGFYWLWAPEY
jgi:protease-4